MNRNPGYLNVHFTNHFTNIVVKVMDYLRRCFIGSVLYVAP